MPSSLAGMVAPSATSGRTSPTSLPGVATAIADPTISALRLPGTSGNYISTPDSAANSITGDIDLRAKVAMDDWTPAAAMVFVDKMDSSTIRSYRLLCNAASTGIIRLVWSVDGTTAIFKDSTVAPGFVDGSTHWIRATLDVDNGAAGNDVKFYTSEDGIVWTQLGATVTTAGVTSIFDTTARLSIGATNLGTLQFLAGKVFYAEVRNGIAGTVVASFDATKIKWAGDTTHPTVYASPQGETWTVNGSGWNWVTP